MVHNPQHIVTGNNTEIVHAIGTYFEERGISISRHSGYFVVQRKTQNMVIMVSEGYAEIFRQPRDLAKAMPANPIKFELGNPDALQGIFEFVLSKKNK